VEAMFPGYLFAKFVYWRQHRSVASSYGIRGILHFGDRPATLSETTLLALRARVGSEEVVTIDSSVKIGQSVKIIEGPFQGLEVVVTHLFPAKERIRVLLEFLGRSVGMEISTARVLPTKDWSATEHNASHLFSLELRPALSVEKDAAGDHRLSSIRHVIENLSKKWAL
jgi:transcription antitermination factor NusG